MFKFLWLNTSHRINKHESYLAPVSVGFTSTQGDTLCVSAKCVEAVTVKGWKKSTTAQPEQLRLEHGICGFVATLSLRNAWKGQLSGVEGKHYWRTWSILCILSCREGHRALGWPWKGTSAASGNGNMQLKEIEKTLICFDSIKGSWLEWIRQTC